MPTLTAFRHRVRSSALITRNRRLSGRILRTVRRVTLRICRVFWALAGRRRRCFASRRSPVRSRLAPLHESLLLGRFCHPTPHALETWGLSRDEAAIRGRKRAFPALRGARRAALVRKRNLSITRQFEGKTVNYTEKPLVTPHFRPLSGYHRLLWCGHADNDTLPPARLLRRGIPSRQDAAKY